MNNMCHILAGNTVIFVASFPEVLVRYNSSAIAWVAVGLVIHIRMITRNSFRVAGSHPEWIMSPKRRKAAPSVFALRRAWARVQRIWKPQNTNGYNDEKEQLLSTGKSR